MPRIKMVSFDGNLDYTQRLVTSVTNVVGHRGFYTTSLPKDMYYIESSIRSRGKSRCKFNCLEAYQKQSLEYERHCGLKSVPSVYTIEQIFNHCLGFALLSLPRARDVCRDAIRE